MDAKAQEAAFEAYKRVEEQAMRIVAEMKSQSPKKVDIELALLTALFELHKNTLPPRTIGKIVQGHLDTLVPFYEQAQEQEGS
ncbi:MAG: hypothetical protein E1N59_886 [Puniceicoccaceae bacterium 5H]|nr:MAG: hypothetical protein E1N59_886 [Puniceicoccaceae bacterium 5H]